MKSTSYNLNDPLFGMLTMDEEQGFWKGKAYLNIVKKEIPIHIVGTDVGPTETQRACYRNFQQTSAQLLPTLQKKLCAYYTYVRNILLNTMPEEKMFFEREMPLLDRAEQLWELIDPIELLVMGESEMADVGLVMSWRSSWDIEHELYATFLNGEIIDVDS